MRVRNVSLHLLMCTERLRNVIYIMLLLYYLSVLSHMYKVSSVQVDLEPFPGTLEVSWEYTLDGTPIYRTVPCTHACGLTQRPHSVSCTSPSGAVGVQDHSGQGDWCPKWPPSCSTDRRKQRPWPPTPSPQTAHHHPASSTHGNYTTRKMEKEK